MGEEVSFSDLVTVMLEKFGKWQRSYLCARVANRTFNPHRGERFCGDEGRL